jgi:2-polyprenyl-3-methyl-5-hydroxy-6-metoxy-1,4-benzoquinol methylase
MDEKTLQAYNADAAGFAKEWHEQAAPTDMYALLLRHFKPGPTVDIGCGSGRDIAWLAANGFDARGFDASESLLQHARATHPGIRFDFAALPDLAGVEKGAYENVLCETVIMHLDPATLGLAVHNLLNLLRPGGTLYLSWRVTQHTSQRDKTGRLYAAFNKQAVLDQLALQHAILSDTEQTSVSSGKTVHRLIVRNTAGAVTTDGDRTTRTTREH